MEQYELAEKDYLLGMKYKDIASKYDVSINTVKSWKRRHEWKRKIEDVVAPKNAKGCTKENKIIISKTDKEKLKEMQNDFSEKQRLFCMYYMQSFNATQAAKKAGYSEATAYSRGHTLLQIPKVKEYLNEIKNMYSEKIFLDKARIINRYMSIAFADANDYITEDGKFAGKEKVDGTLIKKIRVVSKEDINNEGGCKTTNEVSIEMEDRSKALDFLGKHLGLGKVEDTGNDKGGLLDEMLKEDYNE